jgi:hypothetical protein
VVKTRRVASRPHGTQGMRNGGRPCSLLSNYVDRILKGDKPADLPVQARILFSFR